MRCCSPVEHMTVVGGEDDRAARRGAPRRGQGAGTSTSIQCPVGRAWLALVQGVVDRVEHDADHSVGTSDRVADLTGQGMSGFGSEIGLVEER